MWGVTGSSGTSAGTRSFCDHQGKLKMPTVSQGTVGVAVGCNKQVPYFNFCFGKPALELGHGNIPGVRVAAGHGSGP